MENTILLGLLEQHLGPSTKKAHHNYGFICPFCLEERTRLGKSKKPKLEIQLVTNLKGENPYQCWFCQTKGKTIKSLFKKLKLNYDEVDHSLRPTDIKDERSNSISLPKEFIPLYPISNTIYSKKVLNYLNHRGINQYDIIKHNIGYCMEGKYHDRLIIPSYDSKGLLNFFEARDITNNSSLRYLKPGIDRDQVIGFELFINWNVPIIICEGMLDAISIKRNAIPLLGKNISNALMMKIVTSQVNKIYFALDSDALKTTLNYAMEMLNKNKEVHVIELDKDPNSMGFELFTELIQKSQQFTFNDLINKKLEL